MNLTETDFILFADEQRTVLVLVFGNCWDNARELLQWKHELYAEALPVWMFQFPSNLVSKEELSKYMACNRETFHVTLFTCAHKLD